ncbi:MAG: hypothetical protein IT443_08130 [Phycisphaeraceae bacterium]|nr:hypothetical protein [Phycisphaeraceae bacterium]
MTRRDFTFGLTLAVAAYLCGPAHWLHVCMAHRGDLTQELRYCGSAAVGHDHAADEPASSPGDHHDHHPRRPPTPHDHPHDRDCSTCAAFASLGRALAPPAPTVLFLGQLSCQRAEVALTVPHVLDQFVSTRPRGPPLDCA